MKTFSKTRIPAIRPGKGFASTWLIRWAAAALLAVAVSDSARASSVDWPNVALDCFEVVPGIIPHLLCKLPGFGNLDFAVDEFGDGEWVVVDHASKGRLFLAGAELDDVVRDGDIAKNRWATGTGDSFLFAFTWDCDANGSGGYIGWMELTTNGGNLSIAHSALSKTRAEEITVGAVPEPGCAALAFAGFATLWLPGRRKRGRQGDATEQNRKTAILAPVPSFR